MTAASIYMSDPNWKPLVFFLYSKCYLIFVLYFWNKMILFARKNIIIFIPVFKTISNLKISIKYIYTFYFLIKKSHFEKTKDICTCIYTWHGMIPHVWDHLGWLYSLTSILASALHWWGPEEVYIYIWYIYIYIYIFVYIYIWYILSMLQRFCKRVYLYPRVCSHPCQGKRGGAAW